MPNSQTHILVVDDDDTILNTTSMMLERKGYSVSRAANAHNALVLLDNLTPTLIFTDDMMPGMDGLVFCQTLRQQITFAQTPIIMMTVNDFPDRIAAMYAAGVTDVLLKPFRAETLLEKVKIAAHNL